MIVTNNQTIKAWHCDLIAHQLFAINRDVGREGHDPIEDSKDRASGHFGQ